MYENTKIEDATIATIIGKFVMKKGSAAAEGLSVHTGNHMQVIGKFYRTVTNEDKIKSGKPYDKDIIVEEDVWIGCNVTLLAGAHLGRGSVIAAGAVVNKDIPPYCIAAVAHKKFEGLDVPALLKEKHVVFDVKCTLDRSIIDGRL